MLDERKQRILSAVVEDFIATAEPVGSKRLVERYHLNISPATVRNELAALEEMGYIYQPHTSAGRVPTDSGYRYYVDGLNFDSVQLISEVGQIEVVFDGLNHEITRLMRETSQLLSRLTSCAALIHAPDVRKERIKHIDLVGLGEHELMIVVITSTGSLYKQVLDVGDRPDDALLAQVEVILNKALAKAPIDGIEGQNIIPEEATDDLRGLLELVFHSIALGLQNDQADRFFYEGTAYLLAKPEFADMRRSRELVYLLEENYRVLEWLRMAAQTCEVIVSIGAESALELDGLSIVASGYEIGGQAVGALGVIGPTRMDYARAIPTVRSISENLSRILTEMQG